MIPLLACLVLTTLLPAGSLAAVHAAGAPTGAATPAAQPTAGGGQLHAGRFIDLTELGIGRPAGIAWSPAAGALLVVTAGDATQTPARLVSLFEEDLGAIGLPGGIRPDGLAFDAARRRLVALATGGRELVAVGAVRGRPAIAAGVSRSALAAPVTDPAGAAIDRAGLAWVLDPAARRIVRADGAASMTLPDTGVHAPRGLAVDPVSGHFFVLVPGAATLLELSADGSVVTRRDLVGLDLLDAVAITIGPTGDNTDPVDRQSLYIADAGKGEDAEPTGAGIHELPLTSSAVQVVPAATGTLVNTIVASGWVPASPDTSGLAYVPGRDRLVAVDGEVDETTGAGFNGANGWLTTRDGTVDDTFDITGFNDEAVGVAFDHVTGRYFISNDAAQRVWIVPPGADGIPGTPDDGTRTSFFTSLFGSMDPEGLAFGQGDLFIADGLGKEIYRVDPGANGVFQGVDDDVITHFDVQTMGQQDPEGIDYEPMSGHLWVVSNDPATDLLEVTVTGSAVQTVDLAFLAAVAPAGVAVAPSTVASGRNDVFIAARGIDNGTDPTENDGRIYEIAVGSPAFPSGTLELPQAPIRVMDTRTGTGLNGRFSANVWRVLDVRERPDIPNNAFAITGNITVVNPSAAGYVSVLPEPLGPGVTPPVANINFKRDEIRGNNLVAALAGDGTLAIVSRGATSHIVLDVTGYFVSDSGQARYVDVSPDRILDTRVGNGLAGKFQDSVPRTFTVRGRGGVPDNPDVIAVAGNLTVTGQTAAGYVALTPEPTSEPDTSTLNFPLGDNRGNGVVVSLDDAGTLSAVVRFANAHLVFDVTGYFVTGGGGAVFHAVDPVRRMDTRFNIGLNGPFVRGNPLTLTVWPGLSVPDSAVGITGNLTVVGQTAAGHVSMTDVPDATPATATVNFPVGDIRGNGVVAPLAGGKTSFVYIATPPGARTELILDVTGFFAP
jgi:hypothetical protein